MSERLPLLHRLEASDQPLMMGAMPSSNIRLLKSLSRLSSNFMLLSPRVGPARVVDLELSPTVGRGPRADHIILINTPRGPSRSP